MLNVQDVDIDEDYVDVEEQPKLRLKLKIKSVTPRQLNFHKTNSNRKYAKIKRLHSNPSPTNNNKNNVISKENLYEYAKITEEKLKLTIRRKVLEEQRYDILANYVLGYLIYPHQLKMIDFINKIHTPGIDRRMVLGPRGGGKTSICTYVTIIIILLLNPNAKILLCSNTQGQAEAFLRTIKNHLKDEFFISIFGDLEGDKWDAKEINVKGRTIPDKECSVTCLGVGGQVTSKHFTHIIVEDMIDEENSRTKNQREKIDTWYRKTLLNATDDDDIKSTLVSIIGTRYHYDDQYGRLTGPGQEFEGNLLRIPALTQSQDEITDENPDGWVSYWPEKKSVKQLLRVKRGAGIHWYTQYQNIVDMEIGEYFDGNWFKYYTTLPQNLMVYQGVDLAVKKSDGAAYFAHVTIGVTASHPKQYYLMDAYKGRLSLKGQDSMIINKFNMYDPITVGIEGNGYQAIKEQSVKDKDSNVRIKLLFTQKDKVTEALKIQVIFEEGRFFISQELEWYKDAVVSFPAPEVLDIVDATVLAIKASKKGRRKTREKEPGIIN